MATLPGETSPPKSGCGRRVPPLLMNEMKFAEDGATGAAEMSVFHQLSAGSTGSGAGGGAPATGTAGGHCAHASVDATHPASSTAVSDEFTCMIRRAYANVIIRIAPAARNE